ncbi:MAG TPA: GNAT family N-acetyltransferase [Thermoanaerobaculia bacterium]|nr:GNAT family N-acetyltransferase [Thermoanaerobaculia bacterium]
MTTSFPFIDINLARRIERAEGKTNADFVTTRARLFPSSGAGMLERGGAYALFDGADSPLTQTFGLGVFSEPTNEDLEAIESFFQERGGPVHHEVSPLAAKSTLELLNSRGYEPFEFTSVLIRPVDAPLAVSRPDKARLTVRIAGKEEAGLWSEKAAEGWGATPDLAEFLKEIGGITVASRDAIPYFCEVDGQPIATATLCIQDGVAILAGASTVPAHRNQGAQLALLEARLRLAAERGCDLALMGAEPGGPSQRNAERQGFRIAYTRLKWRLKAR